MSKAAELAKMGEVLTNNQIGGRRNLIINGAMNIAQRGTSSTGLGADGFTYNTVDRFKNVMAGSSAGRYTQTQTAVTDLPGFANCLKFDCTTADTSIAADEILQFGQYFEGQDVQQLKKGTSDAETVTASFYVKGNASATYTCELVDADNTRYNAQTFSVTTSWNRVVLTFNADTSGTLDDDNANSLQLNIFLHAGSTYTGGTFSSNTWHTTNNQRANSSQTSFYDSTDRTFFITGVQLEVGSTATPFEHRSFGEEQALCMRYYQKIADGDEPTSSLVSDPAAQTIANMAAYSSTAIFGVLDLAVRMRAEPTIDLTSGTDYYTFLRNGTNDAFNSFILVRSQYDRLELYAVNSTNGSLSHTAGHAGWMRINNASAYFAVSAEL